VNVLLSPLGRAPGAVSGLVYALRRQDPPIHIDQVVTVRTTDTLTYKSANYLKAEFYEMFDEDFYTDECDKYVEIDTLDEPDDVYDFLHHLSAVLRRQYKEEQPDRVYVGISGGQKTMSALATLAVQVHGADGLFYLWVDDDLAEKGTLRKGYHLPAKHQEAYREVMRLEGVEGRYRLIELPIAHMAAYYNDFVIALAGRPDRVPRHVREMLENQGHLKGGEITEAGQTFYEGLLLTDRRDPYSPLAELGINSNGKVVEPERLMQKIRQGEGDYMEFKAACREAEWGYGRFKGLKRTANFDRVLKEVCAFANENGGIVVIGLPDPGKGDSDAELACAMRQVIQEDATGVRDQLKDAMKRAMGFELKDQYLPTYPASQIDPALTEGDVLVIVVPPNLPFGLHMEEGMDRQLCTVEGVAYCRSGSRSMKADRDLYLDTGDLQPSVYHQ